MIRFILAKWVKNVFICLIVDFLYIRCMLYINLMNYDLELVVWSSQFWIQFECIKVLAMHISLTTNSLTRRRKASVWFMSTTGLPYLPTQLNLTLLFILRHYQVCDMDTDIKIEVFNLKNFSLFEIFHLWNMPRGHSSLISM